MNILAGDGLVTVNLYSPLRGLSEMIVAAKNLGFQLAISGQSNST